MKHMKSTFTMRVSNMTSQVIWRHPAVMNETDFSYYKIHWRKCILSIKYQFIFVFIFNKFRFNLYLLRKSYFLLENV